MLEASLTGSCRPAIGNACTSSGTFSAPGSSNDDSVGGRLKARRLTTGMGAGLAAVGLMGALAACSSASKKATATTSASTTPTTAGAPATLPPATTAVPGAPTTPPKSVPASFSAIAGWYDGSTGSSGALYIRDDGASRFRFPDPQLCAAPCSDATAPILNEDISLSSLTLTGSGSYVATGRVAGYSSTVSVPASVRLGVGSTVTLHVSASGNLTLGNLGSPGDVLAKGPPPPGYSGTTDTSNR